MTFVVFIPPFFLSPSATLLSSILQKIENRKYQLPMQLNELLHLVKLRDLPGKGN